MGLESWNPGPRLGTRPEPGGLKGRSQEKKQLERYTMRRRRLLLHGLAMGQSINQSWGKRMEEGKLGLRGERGGGCIRGDNRASINCVESST